MFVHVPAYMWIPNAIVHLHIKRRSNSKIN